MDEDLRDIVDMLDQLENEIWRQRGVADDPKLDDWCEINSRSVAKMKNELAGYLNKAKAAGETEG